MGFFAWIGSLLVTVFSFIAQYFTKKTLLTGAAITAVFALATTLKISLDAGLATLGTSTPSGAFLFGLGLLPTNVSSSISVYIGAHIAAIAYRYYRNIVDFQIGAAK